METWDGHPCSLCLHYNTMARAVKVLNTVINVDPVNTMSATPEHLGETPEPYIIRLYLTLSTHISMVEMFDWHCSALKQERCPSEENR